MPLSLSIKRCKFAMSHRFSLRNKQKGLGLPATIFVITVLAFVVVTMGNLSESSAKGFGHDYHSIRAFYAAESGAQVALNRLFVGAVACNASIADIDFDSGGDNPGLNDCETALSCAQVTVDSIDYFTVTSTATCGTGDEQAQRSIQVRAHST